jgi:hypothetical protein
MLKLEHGSYARTFIGGLIFLPALADGHGLACQSTLWPRLYIRGTFSFAIPSAIDSVYFLVPPMFLRSSKLNDDQLDYPHCSGI